MQNGIVSTDGSCLSRNNEGHGPIGWAWALHEENREPGKLPRSHADGREDGTNQQAELTATLQALQEFAPGRPTPIKNMVIESDSKYVINSMTVWIENWKKNGWKNSKKQPISNIELIQAIDQEIEKRKKLGGTLEFVWVKGHNGNEYNEIVDTLAREQATKHDLRDCS
ncbi:MAG: ribonuclease HI [Candidatus Ancillula sp.]|nr:ribonuclease HI [Candidatus Ancillula sp.]